MTSTSLRRDSIERSRDKIPASRQHAAALHVALRLRRFFINQESLGEEEKGKDAGHALAIQSQKAPRILHEPIPWLSALILLTYIQVEGSSCMRLAFSTLDLASLSNPKSRSGSTECHFRLGPQKPTKSSPYPQTFILGHEVTANRGTMDESRRVEPQRWMINITRNT